MSDRFPFDIAPFNELTPTEQTRISDAARLVPFKAGDSLLLPDAAAQHLWVLHSGHAQLDVDGHVHVLNPGYAVGWRAILSERSSAHVLALDAVQAWQIPKAVLLPLLTANPRFSARVFSQLASRMTDDEAIEHQRELLSLMLMRVKDAYLQKPFYVDGDLDLVSVCRLLSEHKLTHTLVRDRQGAQERIGMFTTTDLRDALLRDTPPQRLAVREMARFELITVDAGDELFDALLTMLSHRVHRVLVRDGDAIVGVLSQLDLMSFMSNHSHLIARQVELATTVDELALAARQVDDNIRLLQRGGMRIEIICKLVSELNGQIFARLWSLLAPPALVANSCLLVLGSEGRGEQILKTDQDNALLLRDGFTHPDLPQITAAFSAALLRFGYPPCPGRIMVTNPLWCQSVDDFRRTLGQWLFGSDPEGHMNLAIFMDARAVAGDATLVGELRSYALELATGSQTFIRRMAAAVNQFAEPASGWWSRLTQLPGREPERLDLKKIGTFPIVQGARALALEQRISALGTAERLQELATRGALPAALARDLIETLRLLMALKLRNNLRQLALGQPISNMIELDALGTLDREHLQNALAIIRQFRQHLRLHYRLDA